MVDSGKMRQQGRGLAIIPYMVTAAADAKKAKALMLVAANRWSSDLYKIVCLRLVLLIVVCADSDLLCSIIKRLCSCLSCQRGDYHFSVKKPNSTQFRVS